MKQSGSGRRGRSRAGSFLLLLAIVLGLVLTAALGHAVSATRAWLQQGGRAPVGQTAATPRSGGAS